MLPERGRGGILIKSISMRSYCVRRPAPEENDPYEQKIFQTAGAESEAVLFLYAAVFGGGGALCVFYGTAYIRRGKKYKRYISVINTSNDLIIDNIASQIPTTYDKAVRDIQSMLDDGFFMNARLDLGQRELIMPRRSANRGAAGPDRTCVSAPKQTFCVKCKNCGATNTVVSGERNECKYCGSPL